MIELMIITKFKTSLSSVVMPVFGSLVILAILPNIVLSPVETTMPIPDPEMQ